MPIYEFVCEACGRLTEVMQKVSDPPPPACPECGAKKLAKLVSRTSFQLKGGGWYADLYSSPKKKPEAPSGAGGKPGTAPAAAAPAASGTGSPGSGSSGAAAGSGTGSPPGGSGGAKGPSGGA